jgi:hypothetical protein
LFSEYFGGLGFFLFIKRREFKGLSLELKFELELKLELEIEIGEEFSYCLRGDLDYYY